MLMRRVPRSKPTASRAAAGKAAAAAKTERKKPELDKFVSTYDFSGALALLEFNISAKDVTDKTWLWLGYCAFHLGDYERAIEAYREALNRGHGDENVHLFIACCMYYLQRYKEAMEEANKGPANMLQNRVLFHCAHKLGDETKLMMYHAKLGEATEDQLSLAAMHYLRGHQQEVHIALSLSNVPGLTGSSCFSSR